MNILIGYSLIPLLFENLCLEKKQLGIPENLSVSLTTFSTMEAQRTDNFSTFVGSAWSFAFSSSPQRPMTSDFEGFSIPDFIHYIYFPILILEKEAVFYFLMFSAKQGNYWYYFYNVFGMKRSLTGD